MATTYNSIQYAKVVNSGRDGVTLPAKESGGDILCAQFDLTTTGAIVAGDIWKLAQLPPGAILVSFFLTCSNATAADFSFNLGTNADTDAMGLMATFAANASVPNPINGEVLVRYTTTAEEVLQITFLTVSDGGAANDAYRGWLMYAV